MEKSGISEKKNSKLGKTWNFKLFLHEKKQNFGKIRKIYHKDNKFFVSLSSSKSFSLKNIFNVALKYLFNVVILEEFF